QQQLQQRLEKLREEHVELLASDLNDEILDLTEQIAELSEQRETLTEQLENLQIQIQTAREKIQICQESLNVKRAKIHDVQGQIKSLEVLQQHAMAKDNQTVNAWLKKYGLSENARLAELLTVESGWELAVETVLAQELQAISIENVVEITPFLDELSNESVTFLEASKNNLDISNSELPLLKNKLQADCKLESFVSGIHCAETLENALNSLPNLQPHESIITKNGIWLGQAWLKITGKNDANHGILQREKNLRELLVQQTQLQAEIIELETQLQQAIGSLKNAELQRENSQEDFNELNAELSAKNSELSAQETRFTHQQQRLQQIEEEQDDIYLQLTESNETLAEIEDSHEQTQAQADFLNQQNDSLESRRHDLQIQTQQLELALQTVQQGLATQNAKIEGLKSSQQLLQKQLTRLELQHHQAVTRISELQQKQSDHHAPIELQQEELVEKIELRTKLESQLKIAREQLEKLEKDITQDLENQLLTQRDLDTQKEKLDALRFELQDCNVRKQTVFEQLNEQNIDAQTVLKTLPENENEANLKSQSQMLNGQIERLGTINLTAIDEYKIQDERLRFLTEQHDDLTQALETLTQAINQIDGESRLRFKATFDKINSGLQEKFPKLFGGGQAYLELTSNEILEAGVTIIARPPGKRNSSIHLLSGGEKALTAVALVFSIFELNPAPFCLLDEVDAPLDDANVGRFSKMVEEMSQAVQFLYISHNKVTMEIAKQLAGVTMKEPGVSRIVAVDIEDAVNLAEI
ncbi:MAG: chromosome segregation protein SMC, partial [Methylococcales bacterium]|nr:chromosome segregation protein SMC [Methylococcales bacterium]